MNTLAVVLERPEKLTLSRLDLAAPGEEDIVNSGLEETMVVAYHGVRDVLKREPALGDLRTAAFRTAIEKIGRSYLELGVFP
jgi:glutamate dehydrogenase (NAD(P)+)